MGQGKAFGTTGTVADTVAAEPGSPLDLLTQAQHLLRRAAAQIAAEACPPEQVTGVPRSVQDVRDLEEVIKTTEHTKWVLDAAQATALARYAATGDEPSGTAFAREERVEYPVGYQAEYADADLAPVCEWSVRSAGGRLSSAMQTVTKTPEMHALSLTGELASWRARAVASELGNTTAETSARVESQIMAARGWTTWSMGKLQRTARALVEQYEADAAKQIRTITQREATNVIFQDSLIPGLAELIVTGPKDELAPIFKAADELARKRHANGDRQDTGSVLFDPERPDDQPELLLGQQRLRALRDLVAANATVSYELVLQVPIVRHHPPETNTTGTTEEPPGHVSAAGRAGPVAVPGVARGPDETDARPDEKSASNDSGIRPVNPADAPEDPSEPAYRPGWGRIPGIGLIHPDVVAAMIDAYGWTITRACLDAKTGTTIETAKAGYVPSRAMRRHVEQRDGTCRVPGCERPAEFCDLDHVTPWPQGATATRNLAGLCRRHHVMKTLRRWSYTIDPDGTCHWTGPTGRTFTTYPDDPLTDQAS